MIDKSLNEQDTVFFECTVSAKPLPSITWWVVTDFCSTIEQILSRHLLSWSSLSRSHWNIKSIVYRSNTWFECRAWEWRGIT